jgi:amino acid transporter
MASAISLGLSAGSNFLIKREIMSTTSASTRTMKRDMGLMALIATAVTGIIGSGWLFASLYAAQIAGPAAIFSWFIGGGVAIVIALLYAEMSGMLPVTGALTSIPYFSHGTLAGFMAGWLCWIAYVTTAPIEVMAALQYADGYLPWLTKDISGDRELTHAGLWTAALLMLIFTLFNMLGIKWLAHANTVISTWKIAVPIIAAVALIYAGFRAENFTSAGGFAPYGVSGVLGAVSGGGVIFSLFGFRTIIDIAGEAKNPQRNVPLAMFAGLMISLFIYIILQVAFIGAVPPEHLENGWNKITESAPGGPFAGFAVILGMQWLAFALYVDAVVSPAGTGVTYVGTTARINYAMAKNKQLPTIFEKLNKFSVPIWALATNFVVGMLLFLPFPGWSELVGFISSAAVLAFSFGPVSHTALRYQEPDRKRPYKMPLAMLLSPLAFILVSFVVYWTGWDTNWKVMLLIFIGFPVLIISRRMRGATHLPLEARHVAWFWLYIAGLALISYTGNYGNGLGLLPHGIDLVLISLFSVIIFRMAVKLRLPADTCNKRVNIAMQELD